eukprot:TRINITY_DN43310_c0_g1_i1.p1 TRINITY_DN43310_c0_g1~~TRINITY_DN43310_c0_g1_i1.p1  ORF type:complete len:361 (+),score=74.98 TRINITY_DN43310_c0_g1_i1:70-1152(+)
MLECMRRFGHAKASAAVLIVLTFGIVARTDDPEENGDGTGENDDWSRLTSEEWRPGDLGDSRTSVPMKDMECEGIQTALRHTPGGITWMDVKALMHVRPRSIRDDPDLFQLSAQIQREEPDLCVLGIAATSALLLPLTMPKFRNMARILTNDQNFLFLNVSFYDTLRSGFPIFGILDDLSTEEYRSWFQSAESSQFFDPLSVQPSCLLPPAQALAAQLERKRQTSPRDSSGADFKQQQQSLSSELLEPSVEFLAVPAETQTCRPATAAALLVLAMSRLQASIDRSAWTAQYAVLRDVIELLARAEELIRDYCWDEGVAFGMLVATPWNFWWLLQRLQYALQYFIGNPWKLPEASVDHAEL